MEATVSQIHNYPQRPGDYEEPLFAGEAQKRAIIEHFLRAGWLVRASEIVATGGSAAHARRDPVELRRREDGTLVLERGCGRRRSVRSVQRVVARWREVRNWWEESGGENLVVYRLLLTGGAVVDVAKDLRDGAWTLVGIED